MSGGSKGGGPGSGYGAGGSRGGDRRRRVPPKRDGRPEPRDQSDRRANAADRDQAYYARKRAQQVRQRAKLERAAYDPAPPDPDTEWTVPAAEGDGLRRTTEPTTLGDALRAALARRGWDERLTGADAAGRWEQIVGPQLAARCEPVRLAGGTLVIRAENQVWVTQLKYMLPQLRANAEAVLGDGRVRDIRLEVGPLTGDGEL